MRILLVGDVHGNMSHMITAIDNAVKQGCDRVFALGDFGAWEHMGHGVEFFNDVSLRARKAGISVYWLDGNHDKTSLVLEKYGDKKNNKGFLTCRPHLFYAPRGHRWTWGGKNFIAIGGAYSIDKAYRLAQEHYFTEDSGMDMSETWWFPEEEMTDNGMDTILLTDSSPVDIMLTHDKPRSAAPPWNRKDIPECWPNQDRIQRAMVALKPKRLYYGHLHYHYQQEVLVGDDRWCTVEGLAADPVAMENEPSPHRNGKAWTIIDTDTLENKKEK